jgi:hypothetical protein
MATTLTPSVDLRHTATATNKAREEALVALINGSLTSNERLTVFPCSPDILHTLRNTFLQKVPTHKQTKRKGAMGDHYDLDSDIGSTNIHSELKVTRTKPSPFDVLNWRPWKDSVEFLQGQLKAESAKRFLGDCGERMLEEWYKTVVKPFSQNVPVATGMTYNGYVNAMWDFTMKKKGIEPAAKAFIKALRDDDTLESELHKKWITFEETWFPTHTLNHEKLYERVKEIIEAKDYWICISKTQAHLIDKLEVVKLDYNGHRPKPQGGVSFHYILTLRRGEETKEVPMEFKFHWKNGGQAVQNLNFMLL